MATTNELNKIIDAIDALSPDQVYSLLDTIKPDKNDMEKIIKFKDNWFIGINKQMLEIDIILSNYLSDK